LREVTRPQSEPLVGDTHYVAFVGTRSDGSAPSAVLWFVARGNREDVVRDLQTRSLLEQVLQAQGLEQPQEP
jgi:hypothetical protein